MDLPIIILVGISLAIDCFAVSLAAATSNPSRRIHLALVMGAFFGLFQAGMMLLGWVAGSAMVNQISGFDHWFAFIILSLIGGKMIYEGLFGGEERKKPDYFSLSTLLILAVATSIDSLGVGLSLAFVAQNIFLVAFLTGVISFIFACTGAMLGGILSRRYGERFEILGGIILIGIGLRILLEHNAILF
ncbi:MAG: manganese efflux pump MntP family protein [Methanolinea sp.]|jgi:putative Mn2+ efflux pump MntP|nr:manganese efflux pump MntP family protein [Methanolinea sp.]